MEFLRKALRSLLIGSLAGLAIALFTNFFFQDLIDRFENLTYYMRYYWKFMDLTKQKVEQDQPEYGVNIIDIDERSQQKLGMYWNWDRSYHANMLNSVYKHYPGAVVFDVLFFDPEDQNHVKRLERLLLRSQEINPAAALPENVRRSILSTINYDRQFIEATRSAKGVVQGIQMNREVEYPEFALSTIQQKMTLAWHDSLHPSSALIFPDSIRKTQFDPSNTKTVIDGTFPAMAQAAREIGYVNVEPNTDGVVREIPLLYAFGDYPPVYMSLSLRTVTTLFGTPNSEVVLSPGKYIDIGKPFKVTKDSVGNLCWSYPNVTSSQVRAIIEEASRILSVQPGQKLDVSTFAKAGLDEGGKRYVEMYCGVIPAEVLDALGLGGAPPAQTGTGMGAVLALPVGQELDFGGAIVFRHDSEVDWVLRAPVGDQEWYMSKLDCQTLARFDSAAFAGLAPGAARLVFHTYTVFNKHGVLVSSIPVLRGKTLVDLCKTEWKDIADMPSGMRMEFGDNVRIPLVRNNKHIVTYFGPRNRMFTHFSYYDIMTDRVKAPLDGKVMLVGATSATLNDEVQAPHDDNFPGVEVHASLINSFITNSFVTQLPGWKEFVIILLVGIIIGFIAYMLKPLPGAILTVVAVFAYFVIAMTMFGSHDLWIPIVRPVMALLLAFTTVMAFRYITEEKDRKFLQNTFKRYLSPELIEAMYKEKASPKLGGDEGIRTAYFTDIQGFSTFSEKLGSPTRLVELLNEYLTVMTDTLLGHYGTLDKYEGDAIIAFFGAPMPLEDHAQRACLTALDMQRKLGDLRKKWISEGDKWPQIVHEMRMRIGINSGAITTGNMGSAVRMNYTMMGDAVNLAARLESAAKQYGVFTMISQFTWDLVKESFEARVVDKVQVVGKSEPVTVMELLGEKGKLAPSIVDLVKRYNQGVELYYQQQWDAALEILGETEKLEPYREIAPKNMSPSRKMIQYCEYLKNNPPGPSWDGVSKLTSK